MLNLNPSVDKLWRLSDLNENLNFLSLKNVGKDANATREKMVKRYQKKIKLDFYATIRYEKFLSM